MPRTNNKIKLTRFCQQDPEDSKDAGEHILHGRSTTKLDFSLSVRSKLSQDQQLKSDDEDNLQWQLYVAFVLLMRRTILDNVHSMMVRPILVLNSQECPV